MGKRKVKKERRTEYKVTLKIFIKKPPERPGGRSSATSNFTTKGALKMDRNHKQLSDIQNLTKLLEEDHCYIVKDGNVISKQLPSHGKTTIFTYQGKVDRFEFQTSEKV